jgi:hypothetical protein
LATRRPRVCSFSPPSAALGKFSRLLHLAEDDDDDMEGVDDEDGKISADDADVRDDAEMVRPLSLSSPLGLHL